MCTALSLAVSLSPRPLLSFVRTPSKDKIAKWSAKLKKCLEDDALTPGEASKIAGALQWASSHVFKRLGRAMIRPIYK